MREWPSIVPGAPEDFYLVINRYAFLRCGSSRQSCPKVFATCRCLARSRPAST